MALNLYILRAPAEDYGQPEAILVAAENSTEARLTVGRLLRAEFKSVDAFAWADPQQCDVQEVGTADSTIGATDTDERILLVSRGPE